VGPRAGLDAVVKKFPDTAGTRNPDHPAHIPYPGSEKRGSVQNVSPRARIFIIWKRKGKKLYEMEWLSTLLNNDVPGIYPK
jgi:hypothetical protein